MKIPSIIIIVIVTIITQSIKAQETKKETNTAAVKYTIENCVSHFDLNKATKTKVGYQYWFADKNFTKENTLKMSIVEPGKSTHAPRTIILKKNSFISWKALPNSFLTGKQSLPDQIPVFTARPMLITGLVMLEKQI